jgi:hypothetical protein
MPDNESKVKKKKTPQLEWCGGNTSLSGRDRAGGGRKVAGVHKRGSRNWGAEVRSLVHGNYATGVKEKKEVVLATHFEFRWDQGNKKF